jgi:two-component system, LuxR family, sensor kinase FixL
MISRPLSTWFQESPRPGWPAAVLLFSTALLAAVAYLDYAFFDASLGILYVLPVLVAATVLNRWQILLVAVLCAIIRQQLMLSHSVFEGTLRFLLALAAYSTGGLLVQVLSLNRRLAERHALQLETQQRLRLEAEQHLKLLAESSPAAIFTTDERGRLLNYNKSALDLFGIETGSGTEGLLVGDHLPVLRDALTLETRASGFRTAAQCTGRRISGSPFIAQVWFSIYEGAAGRRLAAIAVDSSEDVREREERNLRHVLDNNRIIAGAVSHEIRNICGAIAMVYANLHRDRGKFGSLAETEDFRALGSLVEGLGKIASSDLQSKVKRSLTPISLREIMDDLRVVVEPAWLEREGKVIWRIPEDLPPVFAEPFGLTQALLNLAQNSLRAVENRGRRELRITAETRQRQVAIVIEDSGPGIANTEHLFEPFQRESEQVGLGLYVSRALLRSFGGDLRHEPDPRGCRFVAYLQSAVTQAS